MADGSATRAAQRGGAGPLEWRGSVGAFEADEQRCTVLHDGEGWVVVVHGVGTNDEGGRFEWSRSEAAKDGSPVRRDSLTEALKAAERVWPRFVKEHEAAEEKRRAADAKAAAKQAKEGEG